MSDTYEERLEQLTRDFVVEFLEGGVDYLTVVEFAEERQEHNGDLHEDLYDAVGEVLNEMLDRHFN